MNITNLEITQATIELFGGFICLMLLVVIIMNGNGRKSWNQLKAMLLVTSLIFFSEACAYIFRGNTDNVSLFMTRFSNFFVFVLNVILGYSFVCYIYILLQEKNVFSSKIYKKIVAFCSFTNLIILVINLFTGWMYYFDDTNYYHRNTVWYIYTALNLIIILMACIMAIRYRKNMKNIIMHSILFFALVPIIAILIQVFIYGISVTNIGVFLALLLMLFAYLKEWSTLKEKGNKQSKVVEFIILFIIMTVSMSASIVSCMISIERISNRNTENEGLLVANMVGSMIKNSSVLDEKDVDMEMKALQNLLKEFEDTYHAKIYLVDKEGFLLFDIDGKCDEGKHFDHSYFDMVGSESFHYVKQADKSLMTKYMENLDCYLVVEYQNLGNLSVLEISITSIIIFVIGIIMMGIVFTVIYIRERKATRKLMEKMKLSITDDLTGLLNRRAFDEGCAKILQNNSTENMTLVMMDLNGLKRVNDMYGHMEGDELIIRAGKCISNSLGEYGKVYRIGGDEFVALLQCTQDQLSDALATLDHMTDKWKLTHAYELSISKGIVVCEDYPDLSLDEIKILADKLMYQDKDAYYLKTGNERRNI